MQRRTSLAVALVALCAVALLLGIVATRNRSWLVYVALATPLSTHMLNVGQSVGGGAHIYTSDVVVFLALAGGLAAAFLGRDRTGPRRRLGTPVLGLPLLLFAPPLLVAVLRGHQAYGASLVGQPIRLLAYAGIGAAVVDLDARRAYRALVAIFYVGTVWMMVNAAYYLATGTSQTASEDLSTGGNRVLSISVSLYMAGALFLALLNLELDRSARRRLLHVAIGILALVGVVLGYGRAAYLGAAVVLLVFMFRRHVRGAVLAMVPLLIPFLLVGAFALPRLAPSVIPDFAQRISADQSKDANVEWRVQANRAVWAQVHESPLIGVGFGRMTAFTWDVQSSSGLMVPIRDHIGQDPHDGFLYILAGGGIVTLVPFLLILLVYSVDAVRRLRSPLDRYERLIVIWSSATLFVFLLNAASGTEFESATDLLTIWVLLLLPSVAGRRRAAPPGTPLT